MKLFIIGLVLLGSSIANLAFAQDQLTATIIGSGSPKYNEKRASASVLISAGNTKILVDMGNGTQANLHKLGINSFELDGLFFTHHHLDHNEEFVPLLIHSLMGRKNFSIIGPPGTVELTEGNLKLYAKDIEYRLGKSKRTLAQRQQAIDMKNIQGGESFKFKNINISTIEVPHTIHTIAYRFDYNGQSIVITGDLSYSENLPKLAKNADYMIIDSGGMITMNSKRAFKKGHHFRKRIHPIGENKITRAHLNLAESSLLAKQSAVKNLVYTHFISNEINKEASLKEIRKNYSGNVIFGEDLMLINNR